MSIIFSDFFIRFLAKDVQWAHIFTERPRFTGRKGRAQRTNQLSRPPSHRPLHITCYRFGESPRLSRKQRALATVRPPYLPQLQTFWRESVTLQVEIQK